MKAISWWIERVRNTQSKRARTQCWSPTKSVAFFSFGRKKEIRFRARLHNRSLLRGIYNESLDYTIIFAYRIFFFFFWCGNGDGGIGKSYALRIHFPDVPRCVCLFLFLSSFVLFLYSCFLILLLLSSSSIRFIRNRFSISLFVHLRLSHNYWLSFCDYVIKHTNSLFSLFCVGLWPVFHLVWPMFFLRDGSKIIPPQTSPCMPTHHISSYHILLIRILHNTRAQVSIHALKERKYCLTLHQSSFVWTKIRSFHFFDKELPDVAIFFCSIHFGLYSMWQWWRRQQRRRFQSQVIQVKDVNDDDDVTR